MCPNVEDLTQLQQLDSNSVKECLLNRYRHKSFYTWAGPTLVALNPLKDMPELYSREIMKLFAQKTFAYINPHIFALGQRALRHLQWGLGKTHQAIVVNGESGAGKTYSAVYLLSYLTAMETNNNEVQCDENIEELLCKSNPLLESLGNAQTLRNKNSSRFGKLIRLVYKGEGAGTELFSGHIETYLLESTRVARQAYGERNFHIFYQMLAGLPDHLKKEFHLKETSSWSIAHASDCSQDDAKQFQITRKSLQQLNLGKSVDNIWRLLAAFLHLGNIQFNLVNDEWETNGDYLNFASELLGIEPHQLGQVLTVRNIQAGSNVVLRPCSTHIECQARRDTLVKLLYRLMFDTILHHINFKLKKPMDPKKSDSKHLCILDLYGFESFEHGNSLEQLCINYANERLQHYFTINYLKEQQLLLTNEGLDFINLDVHLEDKENLISFLDGPVSVFGVLNEECYLNRGCDDSQVCLRIQSSLAEITRCASKCQIPPSPRKLRSNRAPPVHFAINHYAGLVTYSTVSMLNKNRDQIPGELVTLLSKSSNSFVQHMINKQFNSSTGANTKTGRKHTVLAKFKNSLDNLMKILNTCDTHYVRCVRPSMSDSASLNWDEEYVEAQLLACGVIDTIKVSSFGFPIRMSHKEFAARYNLLVDRKQYQRIEPLEKCQRIIQSCQIREEIRVGKSLVYATEHGIELAERWKERTLRIHATVIQRWWKENMVKKRAAQIIQSWWRNRRRSAAAWKLQLWWRKKRSNRTLLINLSHFVRSVRTVKKALIRWVRAKQMAKRLQQIEETDENKNENNKENKNDKEVKEIEENEPSCSFIDLIESQTAAKMSNPKLTSNEFPFETSELHLSLPRTNLFYSAGVISIRRPFPIRANFFTRKTCLPYSRVLPRSLMPSGLTDAL